MSAEARRELILAAATRAFAEQGYAATTTDTVAREAGVSQPYVVRMFGTKLQLFVEVFEHAAERIIEAFERELDSEPFNPDEPDDWTRLGLAYTELLRDREQLPETHPPHLVELTTGRLGARRVPGHDCPTWFQQDDGNGVRIERGDGRRRQNPGKLRCL